jgi:hypothetical protein
MNKSLPGNWFVYTLHQVEIEDEIENRIEDS